MANSKKKLENILAIYYQSSIDSDVFNILNDATTFYLINLWR